MGEFEQFVLLAILRLGNDGYGMQIREEIERCVGRPVSYGAVYTTLDRQARKGYVTFELGDATPERGGRAKKYFRVSEKGVAALRATRRALTAMWEGVSV